MGLYTASLNNSYNGKIMRNCNGINGVRDIVPSLKYLMIEPETNTHIQKVVVCVNV